MVPCEVFDCAWTQRSHTYTETILLQRFHKFISRVSFHEQIIICRPQVTHHSVHHSVKAGSNYVDLQAASSTTPGWMADGVTNNNGGQIPAPFSDEQVSDSLSTSDHEACVSPGKSQTQVRRGRRRGRRGEMCPSLAHSPLQGTEQCQKQLNGNLGDGNTDSSEEKFKSPIPGSQQPSGKVLAWQDRAES